MKKTLIAASIAALAAGSAQAVTLYESETGSFSTYGKIQLELMNYDGENNIQNNGSRFGFSADRQLNHGLEGFANVEFRFNPGVRHDSNVAVAIEEEHMAVRNSYLGVRGDFGSVMAGNFDSLTYSFVTSQADIMENLGFTSVDGGGRNGQGHTIAYLSPEFNGLTFGLAAKHYSSKDSKNNAALNSASGDEVFNFQVAAAYQATPELSFAVAYDMNDGDGGYFITGPDENGVHASRNNDEAVMAISANYATDLFNVGLVFESHDKAAFEQIINLTAGYNYGAGSIYGVVAMLDNGNDTGVDFALGANYNLGEGFLVYGEFALGNDDASGIQQVTRNDDGVVVKREGVAAVTVGAAYRW